MNSPSILRPGAALTLACLFASAAAAESARPEAAKHLLRYKFQMGEVLRYEVKHATNVRTTIDNTTQRVESQSDSIKAWKVTDVLPNGEMEFMHVVESVRMMNKAPGAAANRYDSKVDKRPPRGFEQAARAVGVPLLVIRIAPTGEIKHREEKQPQPPHSTDMPITLRLPDHAVAVGERWSHSYDVPATRRGGAKMNVQTRRLCKLTDVTGGVASIDVEYQILTPVDPYVRSQLVERLTKGTVHFHIESGRIIEQEHNVDRRVLGFAGSASSMHFVARLQEKLTRGESPSQVQTAAAVSAAK